MTTIGILEGSLRKASLSRTVGRAAADIAAPGIEIVILPSVGDLPHYDQDVCDAGIPASVAELAAAAAAVDGILIVTPEYNWSIPGALKNAIDWLSRLKPNPLEGKAVAIWTVSPGALGGARAHEPLRHVLHSQDARIMARPEIQVAGAASKVDVAAGAIVDGATRDFLRGHLDKFNAFIGSAAGVIARP